MSICLPLANGKEEGQGRGTTGPMARSGNTKGCHPIFDAGDTKYLRLRREDIEILENEGILSECHRKSAVTRKQGRK